MYLLIQQQKHDSLSVPAGGAFWLFTLCCCCHYLGYSQILKQIQTQVLKQMQENRRKYFETQIYYTTTKTHELILFFNEIQLQQYGYKDPSQLKTFFWAVRNYILLIYCYYSARKIRKSQYGGFCPSSQD